MYHFCIDLQMDENIYKCVSFRLRDNAVVHFAVATGVESIVARIRYSPVVASLTMVR